MRQKIKKINHSIAFCDSNGVIYINKHLYKYSKELYGRILKHEREHTLGAYNARDFKLDYNNDIKQIDLIKFCIAHPSGFAQYSPITKVGDTWLYSWLSALKLLIVGGILIWFLVVMF